MDLIIVILTLIFGYSLKNYYTTLNKNDHILLNQLFVYHMIMSIVFFTYISLNGGDAIGYWRISKNSSLDELLQPIVDDRASASNYVYLICYIPSNLLNLHFFTGCILFGLLGYWGILYTIVTLKEIFPLLNYVRHIKFYNISAFPLILFLPNLHFWSAGIGKDTLLFFCVGAFFYAINNIRKRWHLLLIIFTISFPIRPHILLFLLSSYAASYVIKSKINLFQKISIAIFALILFFPLLNSVLEFAKIDEASIESFNQFGKHKAGALSRSAGSAIDTSNLPYPLKVFTFLYRPLFFDAHNIFSFLTSVENVFWLFLTLIFIKTKPLRVFRQDHFIILSAFLFWLIGAFAFAPVLGNLGIIIRERNMFLPGFIIFVVAGLYNTKKFKRIKFYYYSRAMLTKRNLNRL